MKNQRPFFTKFLVSDELENIKAGDGNLTRPGLLDESTGEPSILTKPGSMDEATGEPGILTKPGSMDESTGEAGILFLSKNRSIDRFSW